MRLRVPFRLLLGFAVVPAMFALAAFAISSSSPHSSSAAGDCTADATLDSEEQAFLVLINNHRAANGRAPLGASYLLSKSAQWKSQDMGANNYFAHDDLFRSWSQRTRDCGYNYNTYRGENIAAGNSSAQATFNQWVNSPGHNQNMLSANFTAIGIGRAYVAGSRYSWYWTTNFGGVVDQWPGNPPPANTATRTPTRTATRTPAAATSTPTRTPTRTATRTAIAATSTPVPATSTPTRTSTPHPADTTPPTISVQGPTQGATVSGTTTINISAQDAGGVQKVRVWAGSTYLGYDLTSPYVWTWDTRQWPVGMHVLTVEALDNANNSRMVRIFVWVSN